MKKKVNGSENVILKSSFWYIFCNFLLKGMGFITIPIFSRMLTTEEFGYYNNFTAWLSVITVIGTLSLSTSLIRGRFDFKNDLYSFITSNLVLGSIWTLVLFALVFVDRQFVESIVSLNFTYIAIIFLSILVLPAYQTFQSVQRFQYKYKGTVALTVGVSIGSVVLSLVLMNMMENTLLARVIGAQFPTFACGTLLYIYFVKKDRKIKLKYWKFSLTFSIPYVVHLLSSTVLNSVDRVMITNICGAKDTALYSMAYNIAMVVNVLWDSMNTAYSPWLGEQLNEKKYDVIKRNSYLYIGVFSIALAGVMLIAPDVLYILGGERYISAKFVVPPVMLGYLFLFIYSMFVSVEQIENNTRGMAIATCIAAGLNFVLNLIFINIFGYIAAAYTTLIGYVFLFIFHYLIVKRMGLAKIFDNKYIFAIIILEIVFAGLVVFLYNYRILRYVFILIYILGCSLLLYKNKNILINIKNQYNKKER